MRSKEKKAGGFRLKDLFQYERIVRNISMLLLLMFLALLYIWNRNAAYREMLEVEKTQKELKELNWQFISLKKELNNKSMQTHVARSVEKLGIENRAEPPYKIRKN